MDCFFHPRWPVFYSDNHLLVVYKPAGLRMQRDHTGKANLADLAEAWIKRQFAKPGRAFVGMVHRLDAPVAGVLALARTSKGAGRLSAQLREGRMRKTYLAVVAGRPPHEHDRLVGWMKRQGRLSRLVGTPGHNSQEALLAYRLVEDRPPHSLLEIELETGRHHQIRLQLAALGCPILGDTTYGAPQALPDGRIALLAKRLSFEHPTQACPLHFQTPMPVGWPWPHEEKTACPLWSLEDFLRAGAGLPESDVR
jgi:23S rRNA pseudouridine1911/1915/1917 synthase